MDTPGTPPDDDDEPLSASKFTALEDKAFAPHGQIDCWREEHMLHFRAAGPFNRELFDDFARAQRELFLVDPPIVPWGSVVTITGSALATQDGLACLEEHLRSRKPKRMEARAVAYVMGPKVEGRIIMTPVFRRIYQAINQPFEVFDDARVARGWVQGVLDVLARG